MFCHPDTGVGTLGGHKEIVWLDFDAKCYQTQEACDADASAVVARVPETWIERTGGGGWRIAVKLRQPPTFTNFATDANGTHRGEALFEGRFTVLAPSIHPKTGKPYRRVGWGDPVEVESLEAIGILPAKEEVEQQKRKVVQEKRKQDNPNYGQPSKPTDNPWDIRNFAQYFEGYTERDGWGYAQCPHHPGASSFTSFRVNLTTGQYKLWCNCDPKDVWKSGLPLAVSRGYQVPELPQSERDRHLCEPDPDSYARYVRQQDEQERVEDIAASFERECRKRECQESLKPELNPDPDAFVWGQNYQEAPSPKSLWELRYKPSKIVHERYLNLKEVDASFLCLKSAMNTGKTQGLAHRVSDPNESILIVTHTISLAEALAIRYGCRCYNENEINLGDCDRLVTTADSLWRVPTLNKRFKVMVIDEADQVTAHLTNGLTCKDKRELILAVFSYFAHAAEQYILADADLSGTVIDWHSKLRSESPYILKNTYQPCEGRIAHKFSSKPALFEYGCQLLEKGKRVLFVTDAKTTVKKTGSLLAGVQTIDGIKNLDEDVGKDLAVRFPNKTGRIVHGDNSGKPDVRNFIKNINSSLKYVPLDYLVYNSSMGSGISIDVEAFDAVIVLASGYTLPHTELGQVSHRYRPDVELCFWVNPKGKTGLETNCYKIANDFLYKNWASGLSLQIDPDTGMVGINNPEFLELVACLEARRNWSLMNIEATFTAHLEGMGYQIEPHPDEELLTGVDNVKAELKEHKRIVDAAGKATICKSEPLAPQQYESLKNKPNPDFYERCSIQKFELQEFYGVEVTEELIEKDGGGSLRGKLTRLDLLLNPKLMARRMDLSDRGKHHVITDLKYYTLQRDLLSDLGLPEFMDPEKEYHEQDLIALGERAKLKALDIKKILGITIYVAPHYLRDARILAYKGIKAAFSPVTYLAAKLLLNALADGTAPSFTEKEFEDQEKGDEYCSQLSPLGKLICEAIAIEKRFKAREATNSEIHAILCDSVGVKRGSTKHTKKGRLYRITSESWQFASAVLVHRQRRREQRVIDRERELELEARRFQHLTEGELQTKIEAEITAAKHSDAPALVFLAEQWIKYVADLSNPDSQSHPPRLYSIYDFIGGGVTKSQRVTPGLEIQLSQTGLLYSPIPYLPSEPLTIEQLATGRNDSYEYHDYLKIKTEDGSGYWLPAEWLESLDGLPVRRDPDAYTPRIPSSTLRTWRYWLLGVRSPSELEHFERRRTPADLQAVVDSLATDQLATLQQRFQEWEIKRDWLPSAAAPPAPTSTPDPEGISWTKVDKPRNPKTTLPVCSPQNIRNQKIGVAANLAGEQGDLHMRGRSIGGVSTFVQKSFVPVALIAAAATTHRKEEPTKSPSMPLRAVEILTRAGDWLRGYFYVGRKADRHQLADSTGYRGIFVDDNEFRFVEGVAF